MELRRSAAALVDLLLPGGCAGCGDRVQPWCPACAAELGPPVRPHLPGGPAVLAVGRYRGPLRAALLQYKERGRRDLARPLAELLAAALVETIGAAGGGTVWLVPAPSRPAAARARGGDHVARLCRLLAEQRPDARVTRPLRLARRARDSVGLDAAERAANLDGRVRVRPTELPRPRGGADLVLLVDDVVTSGATLRACRAALGRCGVPVAGALVLCDATPGTSSAWWTGGKRNVES